ncbi:hypothetical protein L1987_33053 [Smallanthus sonchifolius]|uniref:Uncharacterized protein n=1 Tax=Smallanthus sonchifolius TaxID=185202 RepID=A0ACB9HPZ7_9ASTR|nr:hypothetical protein L1987_33053 [Smallanthus sonchifolius]
MKGVALRLSYEEEAGGAFGSTPSQQIGQQIKQVNISTPNTSVSGQPGATPRSVSTPVMGIVSRGPTQTNPENTFVPPQQGPIHTRSQLPMTQLLAAQNILYLPYTPYYPWQNMGMTTTPLYQTGPFVLSNPAPRNVGRDMPQAENGGVIL